MILRYASRAGLAALALAASWLLLQPRGIAAEGSASPAVGSVAPAFRLQDQTGKWNTLDEYRGKWVVVYFYPKDQTPGCTTQACELRDDIFAFRRAGIVVLGVSLDDIESHKAFAEKHGLPFPLLADVKQEAAKAYGVLTSFGPMTIARRDTFIIDPQGKIAVHWEKVKPEGHAKLVLSEVEKLKGKAG
jgi:thioredoxin-dependent peroxiredoxin